MGFGRNRLIFRALIEPPLDVRQRLAVKFQDICRRAHENEQKLRELVPRDSASQGQEPLSHDQQDEDDLMKSEDPVVGAHRCQHLVNALERVEERHS